MSGGLLGVGPRIGRRWSHSLQPDQFAGGTKNDEKQMCTSNMHPALSRPPSGVRIWDCLPPRMG